MTVDAYKNLLRLFVSRDDMSRGDNIELSEGQHHYLRNVMRAEAGQQLRLFNGRNGEWLGELIELSKKKAIVTPVEKLAEQKSSPDVFILASPIKKEALDMIVEKASELGAAVFQPVTCQHTVVHRFNAERLSAIATEAAEQCERLDVMDVRELVTLDAALAGWDPARRLLFCQERGAAAPLAEALAKLPATTPYGILIGPEGGFSTAEVENLRRLPFVTPVSLGPRILRAETALIAALAGLQLLTEK